jgi:hypothetical protein
VRVSRTTLYRSVAGTTPDLEFAEKVLPQPIQTSQTANNSPSQLMSDLVIELFGRGVAGKAQDLTSVDARESTRAR